MNRDDALESLDFPACHGDFGESAQSSCVSSKKKARMSVRWARICLDAAAQGVFTVLRLFYVGSLDYRHIDRNGDGLWSVSTGAVQDAGPSRRTILSVSGPPEAEDRRCVRRSRRPVVPGVSLSRAHCRWPQLRPFLSA